MTYRIVITKTEEVRKTKPKEWKPIGPADKAEYGHTPEVVTVTTETVEIYTQVVSDLDLRAVIDAVNLGGKVKS